MTHQGRRRCRSTRTRRCSCGPRLFLEGNLFVDVQPGTPERRGARLRRRDPARADLGLGPARPGADLAAEARSARTSALPQGVRRRALDQPTAAPRACGEASTRHLARRYRFSAQVNEALPRHRARRPGRLRSATSATRSRRSTATRSSSRTWSPTSASSPARSRPSDEALEQAIAELAARPARGPPGAGEAERRASRRCAPSRARRCPASRAANPALDDANPFVSQLRSAGLEAGAARPGQGPAPDDPAARRRSPRPPCRSSRRPARCRPASTTSSSPGATPTSPRPTARTRTSSTRRPAFGLVGIAGESRSGDANGQYIRVGAGGGTNTITTPPVPGVNGPRCPASLDRADLRHAAAAPARRPAAAGRQPDAARPAPTSRPRSGPTSPARTRTRRTWPRPSPAPSRARPATGADTATLPGRARSRSPRRRPRSCSADEAASR